MNSNSGQVVFDACELRFWHLKVSLDRCSRHSRCDSILRWTQTNETKLVWSDVKAANKHAASLCLSHWHTAFVILVCSCLAFLTIVYFVSFFPTHIDINNKSIHSTNRRRCCSLNALFLFVIIFTYVKNTGIKCTPSNFKHRNLTKKIVKVVWFSRALN